MFGAKLWHGVRKDDFCLLITLRRTMNSYLGLPNYHL